MKVRHVLLSLCCLLWLGLSAQAQQQLKRLALQSASLGEQRQFMVYTPAGYEQSEQRYPVLYLTDGDAHLGHTLATMEFLARNGRMPQLIIVGISNTDRTRDLTPTRVVGRTVNGQPYHHPTSGGADKFLDFIEKELIPQIEQNYRTQPYRLFAGHSLGGLFALHAFTTRPNLFNAVIAASASYHWDDQLIVRRAEEFLKAQKEFNRTLFITLANEDAETRTGFDRYKALLAKHAPKGLVWGAQLMEDEDHGSVVLRTHYYGFRKIFEHWQIPADGSISGVKGVEDHYKKLSARYGFQVLPPENLFNQLGYQLMGQSHFGEAISVLKTNVARYPKSANVYDSLGEAYEKSGKLELAKEQYEKAVQVGEQQNDPNLLVFRNNLQRVTETLRKTKGANP